MIRNHIVLKKQDKHTIKTHLLTRIVGDAQIMQPRLRSVRPHYKDHYIEKIRQRNTHKLFVRQNDPLWTIGCSERTNTCCNDGGDAADETVDLGRLRPMLLGERRSGGGGGLFVGIGNGMFLPPLSE